MVFSVVNAFLGYFVAAILVDENQRSVTMSLAHFVYKYMSLLCLRPFVVIFLLLDQLLRRALVRIIVVHHIFPLSKELVSKYFEGSHSSSSKVFVLLSKRCKSKSSDLDDISSTSTVAKKQI